jgi:hypothetical protein
MNYMMLKRENVLTGRRIVFNIARSKMGVFVALARRFPVGKPDY